MYRYRMVLTGLLMLIWLTGIFWETIPVNQQTGWDGKHYAALASDFAEKLVSGQIDSYQFLRILPPATAYYTLKLAGIHPVESHHVVSVFRVLNLLLILAAVWVFFSISSWLKWNRSTEIVGFTALFFNFAILKQATYYPVLTDVFAFLEGLLLITFYMKRKYVLLFLVMVAGSFTYPLFYLTAVLLFVPVQQEVPLIIRKRIFQVLSVLIPVVWVLLFIQFVRDDSWIQPNYRMHINRDVMLLSLLLVCGFMYLVFRFAAIAECEQQPLKHSYLLVFAILAMGYFGIQWGVSNQITIPETGFTTRTFLLNVFQQSISNPLAFLVFHFAYLGPAVLILFRYGKSIIEKAFHNGAGIYLMVYLVLLMGTETRQFLNVWPVLIVICCEGVGAIRNWSNRQIGVFVILCIVTSRFFIPINLPGIFEDYQYGKFPEQLYFMFHGPFATDVSYYIQLFILLLAAIVMFVFDLFGIISNNTTAKE